jgi:hypothetical protein
MWNVLVERFSACGLTYETDRLPAIAGLARLVQKRLKCEYLAGLWRFQFVSQLLWRRIGRADCHSTYRAPSWSWASSPGKADFDRWLLGSTTVESFSSYRERLKGYQNVNLENVYVRTMDDKELSQVIQGNLRLSGVLIPSYITPWKDRNPGSEVYYQIAIRQIAFDFFPDTGDELDEAFLSQSYYSIACFCWKSKRVGLFQTKGLVLKLTCQKGEYQRVGYFRKQGHIRLEQFQGALLGDASTEDGDVQEKTLMTENIYEGYNKEKRLYTFTII